jgi:hypothetical protein
MENLIDSVFTLIKGLIFAVLFWETIVARLLGTSVINVIGVKLAARYIASRNARQTTYVNKSKFKAANQDTYYEDA